MEKEETVLTLDRVSFSYSTREILQGISLEIPRGAFWGIIGPNGSGKTTLMRVMSGILRPKMGIVYLNGTPLSRFNARSLALQIAVVGAEQSFDFPFRTREVVSMGRFPHLARFANLSKSDNAIVNEALRLTCTDSLSEQLISEVSSGERQRILIARTIAQQSPCLMLDEPSTHLDIQHQIGIFNLLRMLNREHGKTVIVALHDLTSAAAFCDRIALLHKGRIIKLGSPSEVITETMIRETYGVDVQVFPSPCGGFPQLAYGPPPEQRKPIITC